MAINKKLIHFQTMANFNSQMSSGNILGTSIVFIKDAKKIWTHGEFYDCSQTDLSEYLTADEIAEVYATTTQLSGKQDTISDLETIRNGASKGNTAVQPSSLSTVATSGSYNDLSNKPTIPNVVTESTVSGWGFTKNTGTYSKPSTGIPKTDLASAVQTSLGKADTALQSYTERYQGTVTGVKINGTTKNPSSGVVDLGTVITSHQDISGKQDKLVSGTNIKTINGQSLLGSGDIEISGGSSEGGDIRYFTEFTVEDFIEACENVNPITYDTTELFNAMKSNKVICVPYRGFDKGFVVASYTSGEDEEYPSMYLQKGDVEYCAWTGDDHELVGDLPIYNNVQVVEMEGGEVILEALDNRIYKITDPVDFLLVFPNDTQKGATIQFMSGEYGTTLEAGGALWANGEIPQIEPNTYYELSIMLNSFYESCVVLTPFKSVE